MSQLYDQFNRPIPALKRPETREMAAVGIRDRWSMYPSAGLTPGRLSAIFREADWGWLRTQAELFEEMEEKDTHLLSVMQTRRLGVLGLEWQVEDASESAEDKNIAEFCQEQLENLDLEELWTHLLGAIGHGYAAAEILWENGSQAVVRGFNLIHPKNISFVQSMVPLVITEDNSQGVEPKPWQLLYHRYIAKSGHDTRNGLLRVVAYMYLFKNYSLKDWTVFNEIYGMPLRLGKYEPSATPADREALRQAISSLGSDAAGIISKSTEIEFVETSQRLSGTSNPYEVMAQFCNAEMSKAVLGQTLTTDTAGRTGTYAAGKVHAEVRQDLLEADARSLAKAMRLQVLRPLVGFNFGWDKGIPGLSIMVQEAQDLQADSNMVKNLAGAGAKIPQAWIYEHFGIPAPKDGEEIMQPLPAVHQQPGATFGEPPALKAVLPLRQGALELLPQDHQVIKTFQELEGLTQKALAASSQAALDALKPIMDLIDQGADLEALKQRLLAVYPHLDPAALAEHLYQANMLAWMKGRLTA